eukprot:374379_1
MPYRKRCILIADIIISITALYIIVSLFLYMLYEDWNIEHIVMDAADAQYANIIIENFLVFEWIHQFTEYVLWGHPHHSYYVLNDLNLYQWQYLGIFTAVSMFQTICIGIRIHIPNYYLYDYDFDDFDNDSHSRLYICSCIT